MKKNDKKMIGITPEQFKKIPGVKENLKEIRERMAKRIDRLVDEIIEGTDIKKLQ